MDYTALSKTVSHALRHEPWLYELELDEEGWVDSDSLIKTLSQERKGWENLSIRDLEEMIKRSSKKRHEISGNKIRAIYGHSVPEKLLKEPQPPPEVLFHGTSRMAWEIIQSSGLLPMNRQYVHLSFDKETAYEVGRRKDKKPLLLVVKAQKAFGKGIKFYKGNEKIWLSDYIPAEYIQVVSKQ
ncbi:MAG: RNA 2'-phosphotransferase [Candidatus Eremiobacterota bacterium]